MVNFDFSRSEFSESSLPYRINVDKKRIESILGETDTTVYVRSKKDGFVYCFIQDKKLRFLTSIPPAEIVIFYKPNWNANIKPINVSVQGSNLEEELTEKDLEKRELIWEMVKKEQQGYRNEIYNTAGGLATLFSAEGNNLVYRPTDFKTYLLATKSSEQVDFEDAKMESIVYDMRVSSVDAALLLADGTVFVQRRSEKVPHCKNMFDASVGGFCPIKNNELDYESTIYSKFEKELKMEKQHLKSLKVSGAHMAYAPDFSGMVTFIAETNKTSKELENDINKGLIGHHEFIKRENLADYVIDHFTRKRDIVHDGVITLMHLLDNHDFRRVQEESSRFGRPIKNGKLVNGFFDVTSDNI